MIEFHDTRMRRLDSFIVRTSAAWTMEHLYIGIKIRVLSSKRRSWSCKNNTITAALDRNYKCITRTITFTLHSTYTLWKEKVFRYIACELLIEVRFIPLK